MMGSLQGKIKHVTFNELPHYNLC